MTWATKDSQAIVLRNYLKSNLRGFKKKESGRARVYFYFVTRFWCGSAVALGLLEGSLKMWNAQPGHLPATQQLVFGHGYDPGGLRGG